MNGIWEMNAITLIKMGGPLMYPILLCSVVALAIMIDRLIYYTAIKTNVSQLKKTLFDDIKRNHIKEALQKCDNNRSPVAKVLRAGILQYGASREDIKEGMEDASLFEIPKLESRLGALATIAHVSPLLGLLGTVTGMTASFHTVQIRAASMSPTTPGDLAGAIGEALLTTVAGLMVAIPTYVAYNYFVNRVNHYVLDMERSATELVNYMTHIKETKV
ncbi:MAG: MotA/TolQ/ExbB proton channel family protein [Candidatus Omnitrophica bacterium]|nr:MotA/TolQ/ExbB proton channel family protein [Candidatus Omnitrophota bacterium]